MKNSNKEEGTSCPPGCLHTPGINKRRFTRQNAMANPCPSSQLSLSRSLQCFTILIRVRFDKKCTQKSVSTIYSFIYLLGFYCEQWYTGKYLTINSPKIRYMCIHIYLLVAHVARHGMITQLPCTGHVTDHAQITSMIMHCSID